MFKEIRPMTVEQNFLCNGLISDRLMLLASLISSRLCQNCQCGFIDGMSFRDDISAIRFSVFLLYVGTLAFNTCGREDGFLNIGIPGNSHINYITPSAALLLNGNLILCYRYVCAQCSWTLNMFEEWLRCIYCWEDGILRCLAAPLKR